MWFGAWSAGDPLPSQAEKAHRAGDGIEIRVLFIYLLCNSVLVVGRILVCLLFLVVRVNLRLA